MTDKKDISSEDFLLEDNEDDVVYFRSQKNKNYNWKSVFEYNVDDDYKALFYNLKDSDIRKVLLKKWESVEAKINSGGFLNTLTIQIDKEIMFPDAKHQQDDFKQAHINNFFKSIPSNHPDPQIQDNLEWKRRSGLKEAVLIGTLAQEDMFTPTVIWTYDLGQNMVEAGVIDSALTDKFYISALVFKPNSNVQHIIFPTEHSYARLKELASRYESFSEKIFGLDGRKNSFFSHIDTIDGMLTLINDDYTKIYSSDRIDISEIIDRYVFIRKYCAQVSHHKLAQALIDEGVTTDHKRIAYWEKSESDIPPFVKDSKLFDKVVSALAKDSFLFFEVYLRDNVGADYVPLHKIKFWIKEFILYGVESEKIDIPEVIENLTFNEDKKELQIKKEYDQVLMKNRIREDLRQNIQTWTAKQLEETPLQILTWTYSLSRLEDTDVVKMAEEMYQQQSDKIEVFKLWKTLNKKIMEHRQLEAPF